MLVLHSEVLIYGLLWTSTHTEGLLLASSMVEISNMLIARQHSLGNVAALIDQHHSIAGFMETIGDCSSSH